jgi:hypothetical protein
MSLLNATFDFNKAESTVIIETTKSIYDAKLFPNFEVFVRRLTVFY